MMSRPMPAKAQGPETLAQEEPAAQRGAQNAEAAPHGIGYGRSMYWTASERQ